MDATQLHQTIDSLKTLGHSLISTALLPKNAYTTSPTMYGHTDAVTTSVSTLINRIGTRTLERLYSLENPEKQLPYLDWQSYQHSRLEIFNGDNCIAPYQYERLAPMIYAEHLSLYPSVALAPHQLSVRTSRVKQKGPITTPKMKPRPFSGKICLLSELSWPNLFLSSLIMPSIHPFPFLRVS